MFGAIPGSAVPSSLKRREPSSSASTSSRLQRSPTRSRATSRDDAGEGSDESAIWVMVGQGIDRTAVLASLASQ